MGQNRMEFGIDLGTTNSSICRIVNGKPVIQKIEVTDDTMPSCVSFNKKKNIVVGAAAYRNMQSERKEPHLHGILLLRIRSLSSSAQWVLTQHIIVQIWMLTICLKICQQRY